MTQDSRGKLALEALMVACPNVVIISSWSFYLVALRFWTKFILGRRFVQLHRSTKLDSNPEIFNKTVRIPCNVDTLYMKCRSCYLGASSICDSLPKRISVESRFVILACTSSVYNFVYNEPNFGKIVSKKVYV